MENTINYRRKKPKIDKRKTNNGNTLRNEFGFTPWEEIFIHEYLKYFNAAKAHRLACGKSPGDTQYSSERGWRVLQQPHIKDEIDRCIAERLLRLKVEQDDVVRYWYAIAFADIACLYDEDHNFVGLHNLSPEQRIVIKSVNKRMTQWGEELTIELHDQQKAMERVAVHMGMLQRKINMDMNVTQKIEMTTKVEELKSLGKDKLRELNRLLSVTDTN